MRSDGYGDRDGAEPPATEARGRVAWTWASGGAGLRSRTPDGSPGEKGAGLGPGVLVLGAGETLDSEYVLEVAPIGFNRSKAVCLQGFGPEQLGEEWGRVSLGSGERTVPFWTIRSVSGHVKCACVGPAFHPLRSFFHELPGSLSHQRVTPPSQSESPPRAILPNRRAAGIAILHAPASAALPRRRGGWTEGSGSAEERNLLSQAHRSRSMRLGPSCSGEGRSWRLVPPPVQG